MPAQPSWVYFTIGFWVTGHGEERYLPAFLRELEQTGHCRISVRRRIGQLRSRTGKRSLRMVGHGQPVTRRQDELALEVLGFLRQAPAHLAVVLDDLERHGREQHQAVFDWYREPLDRVLSGNRWQHRAAVHFFVLMVEAYFLADTTALGDMLKTEVQRSDDDPESIPRPKALLKSFFKRAGKAYDEIRDGERIAGRISLSRILEQPNHCRSLRTLVKWCIRSIGEPDGDRFQLEHGALCEVTRHQIPGGETAHSE